MIAVDVY